MNIIRLTLAAAALAAGASLAQAQDMAGGAVMVSEADGGAVLTDANGMTLYTFDKDSDGMSACNGDCAMKWPPLAATEDAVAEGDFTTISRENGTMQWAYDGKPLYLWQGDKAAGDMTGDGVGEVWHTAMQ